MKRIGFLFFTSRNCIRAIALARTRQKKRSFRVNTCELRAVADHFLGRQKGKKKKREAQCLRGIFSKLARPTNVAPVCSGAKTQPHTDPSRRRLRFLSAVALIRSILEGNPPLCSVTRKNTSATAIRSSVFFLRRC